jgi:hypothetical protein
MLVNPRISQNALANMKMLAGSSEAQRRPALLKVGELNAKSPNIDGFKS